MSEAENIFGALRKFDDAMQRNDKRRFLQAAITERSCGQCDKWMKSRECPKEHNVNGISRGPSCEAYPCDQFVETQYSIKRKADLKNELEAL